MTAGELAKILRRTPDALVMVEVYDVTEGEFITLMVDAISVTVDRSGAATIALSPRTTEEITG